MPKNSEPTGVGGRSRRDFLQQMGGIAGIAAVTPALTDNAQAQAAKAITPTDGVKAIPAEGATITLRVNGQNKNVTVTPATTLLDAIREHLDLTGAKQVCDRGACGACTVLMDARSVNACMILAVDAIGSEIITVEGLGKHGKLDPVQQAFIDHDACQCGYCIPGFVVRSRALIDEFPNPSDADIREGLSGNICRCAAYQKIFEAVGVAAGKGGRA